MSEQAATVKSNLQKAYGDQVDVKYVNVLSLEVYSNPQIMSALMSGTPLPIVTINGDLKLSGDMSIPKIEKELKALGAEPMTNA